MLWTWINLLGFTIGNQRLPAAIQEDALNKPWRPLPSKRITEAEACIALRASYAISLLLSLSLGGFRQSLALLLLGYWHNDLGGADSSCVTRNLLNAFGLVSFASGAMEVALGFALPVKASLVSWFVIIGAVVFSTIQAQDMYDQEGDRLKGRRTLPLIIGDRLARWTIVGPVMLWSLICPLYWTSRWWVCMIPLGLGGTITYRYLAKRSVKDDRVTFAIWSLWMVSLYSLPFIRWCTV